MTARKETQPKPAQPVMIGFKQEFKNPKVGGEYNPDSQIREIQTENGQRKPFIESGDMTAMGSTRTGERATEH